MEAVAVLEFTANDVNMERDVVSNVLDIAQEPSLSRLEISNLTAETSRVVGALVFDEIEAFSVWRKEKMESFFQPIGEMTELDTTLRIFRPELLAQSDVQGLSSLRDVSITYRNSDNDSAGDADIDAVTVICPGDQADCKPSN